MSLMLQPILCRIIACMYWVKDQQCYALSSDEVLFVKKPKATLVGILKCCDSILIQLFILELLLKASQSKFHQFGNISFESGSS